MPLKFAGDMDGRIQKAGKAHDFAKRSQRKKVKKWLEEKTEKL